MSIILPLDAFLGSSIRAEKKRKLKTKNNGSFYNQNQRSDHNHLLRENRCCPPLLFVAVFATPSGHIPLFIANFMTPYPYITYLNFVEAFFAFSLLLRSQSSSIHKAGQYGIVA